jgi:hypothetical protein
VPGIELSARSVRSAPLFLSVSSLCPLRTLSPVLLRAGQNAPQLVWLTALISHILTASTLRTADQTSCRLRLTGFVGLARPFHPTRR